MSVYFWVSLRAVITMIRMFVERSVFDQGSFDIYRHRGTLPLLLPHSQFVSDDCASNVKQAIHLLNPTSFAFL